MRNFACAAIFAVTFSTILAGPPAPGDEHWFYDYGGPSGDPFDLVRVGDYIYMCGGFLNVAGDAHKKNLARFNVVQEVWERMPGIDSSHNNFVNALSYDGAGNLWVGGDFSSIGGVAATKVARFVVATGAWEALMDATPPSAGQETGPTNGSVDAVVRIGNFVYAGGDYTSAPRYIRRFDLSSNNWEAVGEGLDGAVRGFEVLPNGDLIAGGGFTGGLKVWNGESWNTVGGGVNGQGFVRAIKRRGDGVLFIGGEFSEVGSISGAIAASHVAAYDGVSWSNLNGGLGLETEDEFLANGVYDMDIDGRGRVYIAGDFTRTATDNTLIQRVAYWDGTGSWKAMGSGVGLSGSQIANTVLASGDDIYVGGVFSTGYDAPNSRKNFARWNAEVNFFTGFVLGAYGAESTLTFSRHLQDPSLNLIEFWTRLGTHYQIESSANMRDWSNVSGGSLNGTGNMAGFTLTLPSSERYYRVTASIP